MTEQQPELRWTPIPPKPRERGRIWAIVGLVVLALAITGTLLWFLLLRGGAPSASPTPSPTSPTATSVPSPSSEPTPGASETPTVEPGITPPPVPVPDLDEFTGQVQPRLDDGVRGLDMLDGAEPTEASQITDQLQQDVERLAEAAAPSGISDSWYSGVSDYSRALNELRTSIDGGADRQLALADARERLQTLRSLVGI